MHILFVLDYFPPYIGGIETLFDDVTSFCVEKGYTVTVVTSRHDQSLPAIEKRKGVLIYRVGTNRTTIIGSALWWAIHNTHLIKTVDHIHTSTFSAALVAWLLGKIYKKTCTITIHEIYDVLWYHLKGKRAIFYLRFEKILLLLPWSHIVAVSSFTRDMIQRIHQIEDEKISVILNQIDRSVWDPRLVLAPDIQNLKIKYNLTDCKIGLFVGRLGYEKGLPYLIEAMHSVIESHPTFMLVMIAPKTSDRYSLAIQKLIKQTKNHIVDNNLDKYVLWLDPVSSDEELRLWMSVADMAVVPSMSEGFCYTAVQMQAMGLPLVVSEVGALPEVLDRDQQHIFVGYGKIKELASAISAVLSSPKKNNNQFADIASLDYQSYCQLFAQEKTHYPVR